MFFYFKDIFISINAKAIDGHEISIYKINMNIY